MGWLFGRCCSGCNGLRDEFGLAKAARSRIRDGTPQSLQDLNGNTLTITSTGITSSTGLNIPFGVGSPTDVMRTRNGNHHIAGPEQIIYTTESYAVARGIEQLVLAGALDLGGKMLNELAAIGAGNKNAVKYIQCALAALVDTLGAR